ncbi:hypothetical protein FH972_027325 [Carpinus fangiana]|uniref:Bifunctional inhibitor/plant lipid transfer protein/seed storage helical domain-containing protein n=1 Tax=Carpinus fangiana TaxID=176857 RepID=A0A5N6Q9K2_9ROSI|nr:hypothetical protein FH972_027325 [Carpinus fangiana]
MATPTRHCLILAALTSIQILLSCGGIHQVFAWECQPIDDTYILIGCSASLEKDKPQAAPTPLCCKAIRFVGMPCVYNAIRKEIEELYSMEKLVYIAAYCGDPLEPGTHCGSNIISFSTKEDLLINL